MHIIIHDNWNTSTSFICMLELLLSLGGKVAKDLF